MNLDEAQRKKVGDWVGQGLKLAEIQSRLGSELGLRLTYMEVRMLVDDLKLVPKDAEPSRPATPLVSAAGAASSPRGPAAASGQGRGPKAAETHTPVGHVSVSVDQIARPGAVVSGKVTFSDGQKAEWYFDQTGRLALASQQPGYRPGAEDLQEFQAALDTELSRMGL